MPKWNFVFASALMLTICCGLHAQTAASPNAQTTAPKAVKSAPAPRRDLSGIWGVENVMEGISPMGVKTHAPFTEFGANLANNVYKPGEGPRKVPIWLANDPLDSCDPAGFPRNLLFELRPFQAVQTGNQVLMMYQYQRVWRQIWTDGRPLPKRPDPRWYGYSVGKWADDSTFVIETVGTDLENVGSIISAIRTVAKCVSRSGITCWIVTRWN